MKKYLVIILGCLVLGGVAFNLQDTVTYTNTVEPEVIEKINTVNELDMRIKDAQDAARTDIETEAQKMYDTFVQERLLDVELDVRTQFRKELEAIEAEKRKQIDGY